MDCVQKIVKIFRSESLLIDEELPCVPSRSDNQKSTSRSIPINKRVVQFGFITALIGLFIHINFLMPISTGPEHIGSLSTTEPGVAQQDWKVSTVSTPVIAHQNRKVSTVSIPILGKSVISIEVGSPRELMIQLKELDLWELEEKELFEVPPVVFTNFPHQLSEMNVGAKKKIFLHSLLPVTLVAMAEVEQERASLQMILRKLGDDKTIVFSNEQPNWQERLTNKEKIFIQTITEKYRTEKAGELLNRVDALPVSLVLAQGAFESFWGTSRFAREGNNLFGMWTWGEQGIIPARRDAGKTHKLAVYGSILEAVRRFVLTLNRLSAYEDLRKIRQNTMDSMTIADGLYYYSERGNDYIADVKRIIQHNDLTRYDSFVLGDSVDLLPALKRQASL